jgi:hypothetical protein
MDHICFDIMCIMYFGSFGRILEHFVNFLKWPEKKFEVIFQSIFRPLFLYLLEKYMTSDIYDISFHFSIYFNPAACQIDIISIFIFVQQLSIGDHVKIQIQSTGKIGRCHTY